MPVLWDDGWTVRAHDVSSRPVTRPTETLDALIGHAEGRVGVIPDAIQVSGRFMRGLVRQVAPHIEQDGYPPARRVACYGGVPLIVSSKLGHKARARAIFWDS